MKLALLTDLHANREAVSAVLAHARAEGAERYAFLGDLVGYGADPGWVVDQVREHVDRGAVAVRGNHDAAAVHGPLPSMNADARRVIEWTHGQLDAAQLAFLEHLPMQVEEGDMIFVHANARAPAEWAYINARADAVQSMHACVQRYTFCGHTHIAALYHLSATGKAGEFSPTPGVAIPLSEQRRWLAIPSSAGAPRDGDPATGYALFDASARTITFHRLPYDHAAAAARIRAAGLPERLAERLNHGE
jgi:diadenosine tetraphosphatase ApaH/serine/threonine PP2A family protein phosphatase